MKKIMIYSKHSSQNTFGAILSSNAGIIMYYAIFVCSLIFGCTLYNSAGGNGFFEKTASIMLSNGDGKNLILLTVITLISFLIAFTGALSCVGIGILCIIPATAGFICSQIAAYLLASNAASGLGYFCLIILPGATILITSLISLCAESGNISKKLALINIFGRREEIDFKRYFIKCAVIIIIMLLSVIINLICVKLFSKLF